MKSKNKVKPNPEAWIRIINRLLSDRSYSYASDTLVGILYTIEKSGKVTPGQMRAVQNIRRAADRPFNQSQKP